MLNAGDNAPDFKAEDQNGKTHTLKEYRGKKVVLYFYPRDMTPGCTVEACDFRDNLARIESAGAVVLGVSPDSVDRHVKFAEKESLNFPLLADPDRDIIEKYGVWSEKKMFGKVGHGVQRSTFLIDEKGAIDRVWPKVKVKGHVDEVLDALSD